MKHCYRLILVILSGLLLFSSCREALSPDDLAFRILNLFPSPPPCSQYIKDGEPYTAGYLSPQDFSLLYTGKEEQLPEWDLLRDFRLILSDSLTFFEIHILRTVSVSDAPEVAKLLERRAALIRLHNKTDTFFPASEPVVFVHDCFAVLVATDDNESVIRLLEKLL